MVVHRDGEDLLGALLADDVLVESIFDLARAGDSRRRGAADAAAFLLIDDGLAEFDAIAADVHVAGALDERTDIAVALATERAKGVAVPPGGTAGPAPVDVFRSHVPSQIGTSIR